MVSTESPPGAEDGLATPIGIDHNRADMPDLGTPNLPPLSRRFLEFAGKDLPPPDDEKLFLGLARIFGLAWNRAVFQENSHNAREIDRYMGELPDSHRVSLQVMFKELIDRKRRMFPNDSRIVADCRLKRSNGVVSLEVLHASATHLGLLSLPVPPAL